MVIVSVHRIYGVQYIEHGVLGEQGHGHWVHVSTRHGLANISLVIDDATTARALAAAATACAEKIEAQNVVA